MKTFAGLPSAEQIAQRLLKRVDVGDPPVPLFRILSIWKKLAVVEEDLDSAGYLLPLGQLGAEIIVNRNDAEQRKRFTIAHELGHWVLGLICEKKWGEFKQPPGVPRALLEKWCDTFATNLLMPADLVTAWLPPKDQPLLLDAILRASKRFAVSEEAFFIRVWELLRIQVAILRPGKPPALDRTFSDEKYKKELAKLLATSAVQEQLEIAGSMIFLAVRGADGLISMSGKRSTAGRVLVAVAWPS